MEMVFLVLRSCNQRVETKHAVPNAGSYPWGISSRPVKMTRSHMESFGVIFGPIETFAAQYTFRQLQ